MADVDTTTFETKQCRDWITDYFGTIATSNNAALERAKGLKEAKDELDEEFVEFLRHNGFSSQKIKRSLALVAAFERYPDPLLWECLGQNITRLIEIEDARLRTNIVRRIRTAAQYEDGYISGQKLTDIIKECDPEYFERNMSNRRRQRLQLEAEKQTLARGIKEALRRLENEGYSEEDAKAYFTRTSLDLVQ